MTKQAPRILVSAGEASGDLYTASLVRVLQRRLPDARFAGCPGSRMRESGVEAVIDQSKLAVVGLAEVLTHIPAIYQEYRKLVHWADRLRPSVAILTDSSGFHLRVASALKKLNIPVVYLVAPQAWAWRRGRVHQLKRNVARLLCIFPFEEKFFRSYGVPAFYIGHPLARLIRPSMDRAQFLTSLGLREDQPLIALLPGSRTGEIDRHIPILKDAVNRLKAQQQLQFVLGTPPGLDTDFITRAIGRLPIKIAAESTWDLLAHCNVALAASGTVTVEGALLGAPMVTFYRVNELTWRIGRPLVKTPFFSMVNLIAGKRIVPELIQHEATGERLASEVRILLDNAEIRESMRFELRSVARELTAETDPIETAADHVLELINQDVYAHS